MTSISRISIGLQYVLEIYPDDDNLRKIFLNNEILFLSEIMESTVDDYDPYVDDIDDGEFDIGTSDDQIQIEEFDEEIEEQAQKDAESQPAIFASTDIPDSTKFEDDERDTNSSESGSDEGYRSDALLNLPVCIV